MRRAASHGADCGLHLLSAHGDQHTLHSTSWAARNFRQSTLAYISRTSTSRNSSFAQSSASSSYDTQRWMRAAIRVQACFRTFIARRKWRVQRRRMECAATRIQAVYRRLRARRWYVLTKQSAIKIQRAYRKWKMNLYAKVIQSRWRIYIKSRRELERVYNSHTIEEDALNTVSDTVHVSTSTEYDVIQEHREDDSNVVEGQEAIEIHQEQSSNTVEVHIEELDTVEIHREYNLNTSELHHDLEGGLSMVTHTGDHSNSAEVQGVFYSGTAEVRGQGETVIADGYTVQIRNMVEEDNLHTIELRPEEDYSVTVVCEVDSQDIDEVHAVDEHAEDSLDTVVHIREDEVNTVEIQVEDESYTGELYREDTTDRDDEQHMVENMVEVRIEDWNTVDVEHLDECLDTCLATLHPGVSSSRLPDLDIPNSGHIHDILTDGGLSYKQSLKEKRLQQVGRVFLLQHHIALQQQHAKNAPPFPPTQQQDRIQRIKYTNKNIPASGEDIPRGDIILDVRYLLEEARRVGEYDSDIDLEYTMAAKYSNQQVSIKQVNALLVIFVAVVIYTKSICRGIFFWAKQSTGK